MPGTEPELKHKEVEWQIRTRFPRLEIEVKLDHPQVDWTIDIPEQPGLKFNCHLNQQHDELHLCIKSFWLSWFPSYKPGKYEAYIEAVLGILSGEYRIVEYLRRDKGIGGDLQCQTAGNWKTIGRSSSSFIPRSWFSQTRIIQNQDIVEQTNG